MSKLEDATSRIFRPLMAGSETSLTPKEQMLLATWALKTDIMFMYTEPRKSAPASERHWLYRYREPPPNVRVWAAHQNDTIAFEYRSFPFLVFPDPGEPRFTLNARASSFVFRRLILFIVGWPDVPLADPTAGRSEDFLQLWPQGDLTRAWPPGVGLKGLDIQRFVDGLVASAGDANPASEPSGSWNRDDSDGQE